MSSTQCPGCKAQLSVKGLINCPLCQTFLNPAFLREQKKPEVAPIQVDYKKWFAFVTLGAIGVMLCLIAYRVAVPSETTLRDRKVSNALANCQQRIVSQAEFGDAETPPAAKNYGKGNEFYFAWGVGSFHFKNQYGSPMKMSASCIGEVDSGLIRQLTINGQSIL